MLKMGCQKYTTLNIRYEKRAIKNKNDKNWEKNWNNVFLGCKDYTNNFKPQEIKMINKVLT